MIPPLFTVVITLDRCRRAPAQTDPLTDRVGSPARMEKVLNHGPTFIEVIQNITSALVNHHDGRVEQAFLFNGGKREGGQHDV